MEDKIFEILGNYGLSLEEKQEITKKSLKIFNVSKRNLLESIIQDMDGTHPEYHYDLVKEYIDYGC